MKVEIHQCFNHHVKFPLNALSKAIMGFQKTNYSHYAISYYHRGQRYFVHATLPVTKQWPEKDFLKVYTLKKTYICDLTGQKHAFMFWVAENLGKLYPFMQLVGIALRMLKFISKNPFGGGKAYLICNELVIIFLNKFYGAKIKDIDSLDLNDTERLLNGIPDIRAA